MINSLPPLPSSWSALTWQQLTECWTAKIRYGGNADAARAAALLALVEIQSGGGEGRWRIIHGNYDSATGEQQYILTQVTSSQKSMNGIKWIFTSRELSQIARQAMPWFDFPYGDHGEPAVKDEKGIVTKEARDPVRGYVGPMRDALQLPETEVMVGGMYFALPQVACNNITWQQYRSLQVIVPQLFAEDNNEQQILDLKAQFMAHCLVPSKDDKRSADRFRPAHIFRYDAERAEQTIAFWRLQLSTVPTLFHICFQCYQTALSYYEQVFPILFHGDGKQDPLHDVLTGESDTLNSIMKYQGYSNPQEVYDANLPIILSSLNTMTKEAKEIEKMNSKIKKK